ncbi:hypothetical protein [Amphibacillus cookii]|uniref:hypothetical protein n=1 Tax=Amphibacillus cookii TaxID=767787 RepID=UPI00195EE01B|nr:hypothetical protein [Amphibacillus cookii]MBM7540397.1 hypothetical protein [Amphibacillus cookii]
MFTSTLPYLKTDRNIVDNKVIITEVHHELVLEETLIKANTTIYHLSDLYDVNYRSLSPSAYLFHLYTTSGIHTFQTKHHPEAFKKAILFNKQNLNTR